MGESNIVAVVPLDSTNYSTWKIQFKLAFIEEGFWGIMNGTERTPNEEADQEARFAARRDKALHHLVGHSTKITLCNWR
jgi:hypothetical protein